MKFVNLHGGWKAGTQVCGRARGDSRIKKQSKLILNPKKSLMPISVTFLSCSWSLTCNRRKAWLLEAPNLPDPQGGS